MIAPDLSVRVDGLDDLRRGLRKVDKGLSRGLGQAGKNAAKIVADAARGEVPQRSGSAAQSVRALADRGGGAVKAGGPKAPYYPWLDFGGRVGRQKATVRPFRKSGRYIFPALEKHRDDVVREFERLVAAVIRDAGF